MSSIPVDEFRIMHCNSSIVAVTYAEHKKYSHLTHIAPLTNFAIEYDTCEMLGVMYPFLSEFNLGRYVEPMVWHYTTAESFQLTPGYYCYFLYIICNSV